MTVDFSIAYGLPFISATLTHQGKSLTLNRILIDTGSATTIFRTDALKSLGISPRPTDRIGFMVGVGEGFEAVLQRDIDAVSIGALSATPFTIQMGLLNYRIEMNGILGADFLLTTGAVVDFAHQHLYRAGDDR